MSLSGKIRQIFNPLREKKPQAAYDCWAASYDHQPGNLVLDLDEAILNELLQTISLRGKVIADIGCGTGRHWAKLYQQSPARLLGYDVSAGMLQQLKQKYPDAETHLLTGEKMVATENGAVDIILSTLALAHVPGPGIAFTEWNRVLKPGGHIIVTDYHPATLAKGGKRTFEHEGKTLAVKSYVHELPMLRKLAGQLDWSEIRFIERLIDDSVKKYYEKQQALHLFEKFKGTPIVYGIHLTKADDSI